MMNSPLRLTLTAALCLAFGQAVFGQLTYTPYAITTFAGSSGQSGAVNATGSAASFSDPAGIATDSSGNLYIADQGNGLVRKITPGAVVSTFASSNLFGFLAGLAVDSAGNVYTANLLNNVVIKISPSGTASILAGVSGSAGAQDGSGATALFNNPNGVAVDSAGNVYVADNLNHAVRKISPGAVVSTLAGTLGVEGSADGIGPAAKFNHPSGVAVDSAGNVYVTDTGNGTVRKITPEGAVSTIAGTPGQFGSVDATGSSARFGTELLGIAVDSSGNLFVADEDAYLIRRITPAGVVTTVAGVRGVDGEGDGTGNGADFKNPGYVAVDIAGNLYITDSDAETIRKGVSAIPPNAPTVTIQGALPGAPIPNSASTIMLTASTTGNPTSYQWLLNGAAIPGATSSVLILGANAANAGDISVTVSNSAGSASADAGTLFITTDAWLVNLSARAFAETGANQLIAGFVTTGTDYKSVLVRGDGPSLATFGVTDFLSDPVLSLFSGSNVLATESSWSVTLDPVFAEVGAYNLTPGSHDTALLESLAPGPYTAQVVSQSGASGVALAEVYDADNGAPVNRLVNISARAFVGTGGNILIGGFVIGGTTPQTVIIRGDGPALTGFGISGALTETSLTISNSSGTIATNSGWSTPPAIGAASGAAIFIQPLTAALSARVGAFTLAAGSADSAIVATLPPGAYTAQVVGVNGSTGVALVEIYEVR